MRIALVAGATGLVGSQCLARLLREPAYERVIALVRRPLPQTDPRLDLKVIDFDRLGAEGAAFPAATDVFCCLGTTMKKAGSEEAFRLVDFTYVVGLAAQSLEHGARQFLLVSSIGASRASSFFYTRVKGETEDAIAALPFEGRQIFRPSILVGARAENRPGERAWIAAMRGSAFLMLGPMRKYRPVAATAVAEAMVRVALRAPRGVNIYESNEIERIARG